VKKRWMSLSVVCGFSLVLNACGGAGGSTPTPKVTHFSVSPSASTVMAGTVLNLMVSALDATGAVVSSYAGTVHFTSTDAQAVLRIRHFRMGQGYFQ
jgi:hypothetical protein